MLKICHGVILLLAVITIGILNVCSTALNGDETEDIKGTVEMEKTYRNPFSLPAGVGFVKKEKEKIKESGIYSEFTEWSEGEVASSVSGIFQSGGVLMANINGKWVSAGDQVGEEHVLEIREDAVVLMGKGNEKRELSLQDTDADLKVINRVKPKIKEIK